ncbi:MAG: N-acetylmuramoyl-L-alanine amidase, partial [Tropicimonas sp.]
DLSVWPAAGDDSPRRPLEAALVAFGYDPDLPPDLRLAAFRLRFRPGATGPADGRDAALAADLARRWPVDRAGPAA